MNEMDGFKKILDEMLALKIKKASDYGNTWRVFGVSGLYSEIGRKFSRFWINRYKPQNEIKNEMLRDTLFDLAVYAIMSIQLIDENDTEDKIFKELTK